MNQQEKSELVMDDTTIYEIDLACQECQKAGNRESASAGGTIYWDLPPSDCHRSER